MWATGTASDVWKRIAAPMVGGIFTSFVLELVVYPAIYEVWKWHFEMKRAYAEPPPGALPSPDEAARGRTYKALHEKAMGGPHAEQVNLELVNSLGQKLGARGSLLEAGAGSVKRHHAP
jgi:hypothetical protein